MKPKFNDPVIPRQGSRDPAPRMVSIIRVRHLFLAHILCIRRILAMQKPKSFVGLTDKKKVL